MADVDRYLAEVFGVLDDVFAFDEMTAEVVRRHLGRCRDGVPECFELICDDPGSANARLKAARDHHRHAFRIADYRMRQTGRFDEANRRLVELRPPRTGLRALLSRSR